MASCERTVPIHRIEYDVNWPPEHVASYLIGCEQPVLVDAGMPGADGRKRLCETLATHGYDLNDIEHLIVTHPHIDHIGQISEIVDAASPTVYAPVGVQTRFERNLEGLETTVRENARTAGFSEAERDVLVDKAVESLRRNRELLAPEVVDVWVDGGDIVEIGEAVVDVLHTPGHQADHCCYRLELNGEDVLISGDMVIEPFRPVILHAGLDQGVERAVEGFYTALDRISALDIDRVYPGHGPVHTDFEATLERDRNSLDRTLEKAVDTVGEGHGDGSETPMTAADVATERTGSRDTTYIAVEVVAALSYLRSTGQIRATERDGMRHYVPE
ncbi:MBL fold metallo-hydrolase [Halocatena salina]|uniref:MBL fold metallo-hydrolase n=1 Tax=Halocatena salina TaxID=2934340 RepID=A0A8U0A5T8_9EURY|nr:MBL fold metallo-hydrolase [Halocatena salina]UPM43323.1 MBL fold metallo-hydrolase [Halocatena salina]